MTTTKAVGFYRGLPIDDPASLVDVEIDVADPDGHDLLVEVRAVSVNPADTKIRRSAGPQDQPKIIGYDAAGVVRAVGEGVANFEVGDEVFYAGTPTRPGSNAGLQLVDERIVGHKPRSLSFAEAAALPLTSITAWEILFEKLSLHRESEGTLLVLAAAGGVGSMLVQIARKLTRLTVIGVTSRPENTAWAMELGAHHTVDRHHLVDEVQAIVPGGLDYVFSPFSAGNVENFATLLKPRGAVVAIDEPAGLDLLPLKPKSQTWHWEFMFTRPISEPESDYQHDLLEQVSEFVDDGTLRTTLTRTLTPFDAEHLRQAYALVETSTTTGKVVVTH